MNVDQKVEDLMVQHAEVMAISKNTVEAIDELKISVDRLERRLFVDNGHVSIQTRLDRHERFIKACTWLSGVCLTAVIGVIATSIL